ncbi:MAG: ASCH domain-containing protein [Halobacteriota archaeon]
MARIEAAELLPSEKLRQSVVEGEITQLHRGDRHAEQGDTFEIDGVEFEVVEVRERRLGDLTDEDARAEGSSDLEAYRRRVEQAHEGLTWDDEDTAYLHDFERLG